MSAHFAVLQAAGLVETEKDGPAVIYRLKMPVLEDALLGVADVRASIRPWGTGRVRRARPTSAAA